VVENGLIAGNTAYSGLITKYVHTYFVGLIFRDRVPVYGADTIDLSLSALL
jgi:hypothetical protein